MVKTRIFGKNLYTYRVQSQLTQREVADKIGVRQQTVAAWETSRSTPSPDVICSLAKIFGITTDELLLVPREREKNWLKRRIMVPVVQAIKEKIDSYTEKDIEGFDLIEGEYGVEYFFYKMADNSMEPKIFPGDLLLFELCSDVASGEVAAVILEDGTGVIRKVIKHNQGVLFLPLSNDHPIRFIPNDGAFMPKIVGRLVKMQRQW